MNTILKRLCFVAGLGLCACDAKLTDMHTDLGIDKISEKVPAAAIRNWSYDANTNDLKIPDFKGGGNLILLFAEAPAKDNPRGDAPIAIAAIAEPHPAKGAFKKPLTINGKPFTGGVDGVLAATGEVVLEFNLNKGTRCGSFFVRTASNRTFTNSDADDCPMRLDVGTARKPVLYLYPKTETTVQVKVNYKGELTHTYPKYDPANGWLVQATPEGKLTELKTGKTYYELFWEGVSAYQYPITAGFCVHKSKIADFLDEKTEQLGLNRREANEFITYWLPELERSEYALLHFATQTYTEQAPLEIQPQPNTSIRFLMLFSPSDRFVQLPAQTLQAPAREGFTVVEWGGMRQDTGWENVLNF